VKGAAAALRELSARVLVAGSSDEVVEAYVAAVHDTLGIDRVHLAEISQDAAVGHTLAVGFETGPAVSESYTQVLDDRPSAMSRVVASGLPEAVPDARASATIRPDYVKRFDVGSVHFFPLAWAGEVRYVSALICHAARELDEEEVAMAESLANLTAAALALHESESRHAAQHERDSALARAAKVLNESLDLPTVLATLSREAYNAVDADMAGVYLGNAETGGTATAGHNTPPDWHGYVMKAGEGVGGQVLATGRPAISNAYQSDVQLPDQPDLRQIQTAVAVPMAWGGELKGALSIGFVRFRRVTVDDLRTLEAIADLATVACRNAETFQRIESATRLDSLTGLLDHGAVQARVREEIERARREGGALAALIVALDDFEAVNAAAGHVHGDDVLVHAASVMRHSFRPYDALGRYGGDQFAVVLPRCSLPEATELAQRLQLRLADEVPLPEGLPVLSATIGIAAWEEPQEANALLDRVLGAVRDAKRSGGGRVLAA
jgi:diguanylate cyclase (GGDEF)-like protein